MKNSLTEITTKKIEYSVMFIYKKKVKRKKEKKQEKDQT